MGLVLASICAEKSPVSIEKLTIKRPDDWHVHLRDGAMMRAVLPYTTRVFARAIVMPNLESPIKDVAAAAAYRDRIRDSLPQGAAFAPLMTAYLTDNSDPHELAAGQAEGVFAAAKLYPANATTNSAKGVTDIRKLDQSLERMASIGMPLLVHGEVTDPAVDVFDREEAFIERILAPLVERLPELKIVVEHVTTRAAVDFVMRSGPNLAATITAHHLVINRNALFAGGINPHMYCLPLPKREEDRLALRRAATAGNAKFFLGTDSAPHPINQKECSCGCAGIFSAPAALEIYAQVFEEDGALRRFEDFASINGPRFYGLPINQSTITLERSGTEVPNIVHTEIGPVRPFLAGQSLNWRII
jgi:dihydroorotase